MAFFHLDSFYPLHVPKLSLTLSAWQGLVTEHLLIVLKSWQWRELCIQNLWPLRRLYTQGFTKYRSQVSHPRLFIKCWKIKHHSFAVFCMVLPCCAALRWPFRISSLLKVQPWQLGAEGKKCYGHPLLHVFLCKLLHPSASFRIISLLQFLVAWRCIRGASLAFLLDLTAVPCSLSSQSHVSLNGSCKERLGILGLSEKGRICWQVPNYMAGREGSTWKAQNVGSSLEKSYSIHLHRAATVWEFELPKM